jgi:hypothetical protein
MYPPKKLALNSIGLILLVFGGMLFLWGVIGSEKVGQTLETAQSSVGGMLIGILGIALLWKGSKIKETPRHLYTD